MGRWCDVQMWCYICMQQKGCVTVGLMHFLSWQ